MRVARVCRAKHPDLDGIGPSLYPGRWNSVGTGMVNTGSCGAAAVLEYRVHVEKDPDDLLMYSIDIAIDGDAVEKAPWTPDIRTSLYPGFTGLVKVIDKPRFALDVRLFDVLLAHVTP